MRGNPLLGLYRVRAGPGSTDYAEEKTAALFVEGRKGGDSELWAAVDKEDVRMCLRAGS